MIKDVTETAWESLFDRKYIHMVVNLIAYTYPNSPRAGSCFFISIKMYNYIAPCIIVYSKSGHLVYYTY